MGIRQIFRWTSRHPGWSWLLLILLLIGLWWGWHGWFRRAWPQLLVVERPMKKADAIVLLGGETESRARRVAELYKEGVADRVVVVGSGDNDSNRRRITRLGVPEDRILTETESVSTYENAKFSKSLFRKHRIERALLVTSRFHTRRALATFEQLIPEVEFGIVGTIHPWHVTKQGRHSELEAARREWVKVWGYAVRYGVVCY